MNDQPLNKPRSRVRYVVFAFVFGVPLAVFLVWWFWMRSEFSSLPASFDGTSDQLKQTVIVPTLYTPMPEGKNVIWCASFQIAWNKFKTDLAGGPVQVENAQPLADQLNTAPQTESDLPLGSFYTVAGRDGDGIQDTIRADMDRLFPGVTVSPLPTAQDGVTAFAYLRTSVHFEYPYFEEPKGFRFADGAKVSGFGLTNEHEGVYKRLRNQVAVLYAANTEDERPLRFYTNEYALDLCRSSKPNQLVVARITPRETLSATLAALQTKIDSTPQAERERSLNHFDTLRVPNMSWRIEHHFAELEGKDLLNPAVKGLTIDLARQIIEFQLDRSGAELASEAVTHAKGGGPEFHFDRPFLLYIKKCDAAHPFFVMWVANDELLQKQR